MSSGISRRTVFLTSIVATAASFFTLGVVGARRSDAAAQASYQAALAALRSEVKSEIGRSSRTDGIAEGTGGEVSQADAVSSAARARMIAEIKEELQSEMGLLPVQLLRDRRS